MTYETRSRSLATLINQAVAMRAGGKKWREVAVAVGRRVDTVRAWPQKKARLWRLGCAELWQNREDELEELRATSLRVMREMLEDQNAANRLKAAALILQQYHRHARRNDDTIQDEAQNEGRRDVLSAMLIDSVRQTLDDRYRQYRADCENRDT